MSIKPLRIFVNNNAWAIIVAIGTLVIGYVFAQTDRRYPLRSEFEVHTGEIATHDRRITDIERLGAVASAGSAETNRKLDKQQGDIENINRQVNRLVGAFEARGLIQPTVRTGE